MVSSTVPRLDDRWPPVRETESSRKARNSSASGFSWLRLRRRRSLGASIFLSRSILCFPLHDQVGKLAQPSCVVSEREQRPVGVLPQFLRQRTRLPEAEDGHVGGLLVHR